MITLSLLTLAALWLVVLRRYPAYFVPRKSIGLGQNQFHLSENWIEVLAAPRHHETHSMQEVG
jgi:hypothetical protein